MVNNSLNIQIYEKVKNVIIEVLQVRPEIIQPECRFIEDLDADSLDIVTLVMALEEEFKGNILDEDAKKLTTVGETVEFITKMMEKNQRRPC